MARSAGAHRVRAQVPRNIDGGPAELSSGASTLAAAKRESRSLYSAVTRVCD